VSGYEVLQEKGYRLTPQLHNRYSYSSISTGYRTLESLKVLNLVSETDFGDWRVRYHVAEKGHRHHLVCHACGKITDLEESVLYLLKDALLRDHDFEADLRHIAISGECSEYRKRNQYFFAQLLQLVAVASIAENISWQIYDLKEVLHAYT